MLELRRMRELYPPPSLLLSFRYLFFWSGAKELTWRFYHRMVTLIVADYLGFITK